MSLEHGREAGPHLADRGIICVQLLVKQWGLRRGEGGCKERLEQTLEECSRSEQAEKECQERKRGSVRKQEVKGKNTAPESPGESGQGRPK